MEYQQVITLLQKAYNLESARTRDQAIKEDWKMAERQQFLDLLKREKKTTLLEVGAGMNFKGMLLPNNT